jgi:hypothetical protein
MTEVGIFGSVLGLRNKNQVKKAIYEIVKKRNANNGNDLKFRILKYYDELRKKDYYSILFYEKNTYQNNVFFPKRFISASVFSFCDNVIATKKAKEFLEKIGFDSNAKKVFYVENDEKLVINEVNKLSEYFIIPDDILSKMTYSKGVYKKNEMKKLKNQMIYNYIKNKLEKLYNKEDFNHFFLDK